MIKTFRKSDYWVRNKGIDRKNRKLPQDYEDGGINVLDDLNEKEMNGPSSTSNV